MTTDTTTNDTTTATLTISLLPPRVLSTHGTLPPHTLPTAPGAFSASTSGAPLGAAGGLPTRFKILNWGVTETLVGPVVVGLATVAALRRQLAEGIYERVVVDFDHQSEVSSPTYVASPRSHAAYGRLEVVENDGIYLSALQWTPTGERYAREYGDLSPTVRLNERREVVGITSVALCTNGAVPDLAFFSARTNAQQPKQQEQMTMELAQLIASMNELKSRLDGQQSVLTPLTPLAAEVSAVKGEVVKLTALTADIAALKAAVEALRADAIRRDKDALLETARREGKVVSLSADVLTQLSVAQLGEHIKNLPVTVPLSARTPGYVQEPTLTEKGANYGEISRLMGYTPKKV